MTHAKTCCSCAVNRLPASATARRILGRDPNSSFSLRHAILADVVRDVENNHSSKQLQLAIFVRGGWSSKRSRRVAISRTIGDCCRLCCMHRAHEIDAPTMGHAAMPSCRNIAMADSGAMLQNFPSPIRSLVSCSESTSIPVRTVSPCRACGTDCRHNRLRP